MPSLRLYGYEVDICIHEYLASCEVWRVVTDAVVENDGFDNWTAVSSTIVARNRVFYRETLVTSTESQEIMAKFEAGIGKYDPEKETFRGYFDDLPTVIEWLPSLQQIFGLHALAC